MKAEEQRIAIAEACEWTMHNCGEHLCAYRKKDDFGVVVEPLPDYLADLNAMHAAEKVLTKDERYKYYRALHLILEREYKAGVGPFEYAHATAAQRAEAFLRTLGKWVE